MSSKELIDIYYKANDHLMVRRRGNNFQILSDSVNLILDEWVFNLWNDIRDKKIQSLLQSIQDPVNEDAIRVALGCLCEAGLLKRNQNTLITKQVDETFQPPQKSLVSVVIVAYKGKKWLEKLIPSIKNQSYHNLEVIIVDNASPSLEMYEWLLSSYSDIKVIRLSKPLSFAAANNLGIQNSKGEYIILLNQDTYLEEGAIANALIVAQSRKDAAAIAFKLKLSWSPSFLNSLGNYVEDHNWGADIGYGILDIGQFLSWNELPSACFAGVLIPKNALIDVGLLDPNFPMYYEDSEWCYRARSMGWKIYAAPKAIVFHAFGGANSLSDTELDDQKLLNACYGRLRFAIKLAQGKTLTKFVLNYLIEDVKNFLKYLVRQKFTKCLNYIKAWSKLLLDLGEIINLRNNLSRKRKIDDKELFHQIKYPLPIAHVDGIPYLSRSLIEGYYYQTIKNKESMKMPEFDSKHRKSSLLIISNDVIDTRMAGPGMRYLEMSKALSQSLKITLAIPNKTDMKIEGVRVISYSENEPSNLKILIENHDYSLITGYMVNQLPFLVGVKKTIIIDLYDPFFFENLYYYTDLPIEQQLLLNSQSVDVANKLAKLGSFFICGTERQRDLWLGLLVANQRVNPYNFLEDDTLKNLIDVVGIGMPDVPPLSGCFLRNNYPGFDEKSKIVLWGGGIWNWLDPLTLIEAWPFVISKFPEAKLVFLGTKHPNPLVPKHKIVDNAIELAREIGELDKSIVFIEWVDYDKRQFLLSEADVGVTLHSSSLETRYSIRTRILDYFWAGLPVLITSGDITSEWVQKYNVGAVVNSQNVEEVANKLIDLLSTPKENYRSAFEKIRQDFEWSKQVEPLKRYCNEHKRAPDFEWIYARHVNPKILMVPEPKTKLKEALLIYATEGWKPMWSKIIFHLKWLLFKKTKTNGDN